MNRLSRLLGVVILSCSGQGGHAEDGGPQTFESQDENGTTIIRQSGDPAQAELSVKRTPGQTVITRKSGGNSVTVIQSTSGGAPDWRLDHQPK